MPTVLLCAILLTMYSLAHHTNSTHPCLYVCVLSITITGGGGVGKAYARAGQSQIGPLVMFGNNW